MLPRQTAAADAVNGRQSEGGGHFRHAARCEACEIHALKERVAQRRRPAARASCASDRQWATLAIKTTPKASAAGAPAAGSTGWRAGE
eukprot:5662068-Pleurochrysis_carterae.AAC.1